MIEFRVSEFYDMVISILETILKEVVSENPNGTAVFSCIVAQTPMRLDEVNGEDIPILSDSQ